MPKIRELLFQFQTGSIKSVVLSQGIGLRYRFNSKLVRLEGNYGPITFEYILVSIPNWFD